MRKILYPLFLLAVLATVGTFFWSDISPFWQKVLLGAGLLLAFFAFKGILSSLFGFVLNRFSTLLKWIIAGILFILTTWGIWNYLPEGLQKNLLSLRYSASSSEQMLASGVGSLEDAAKDITQKGVDAAGNAGKKLADGGNQVARTLGDAAQNIPKGIVEVGSKEKAGEEKGEEKRKAEGGKENSKNNESQTTWKKPVVEYVNGNVAENGQSDEREQENNDTQNTENAQLAAAQEKAIQENIAKKKKEKMQLVSSGQQTGAHRIAFPVENAQVVYPVEYILSNAVFTQSTQARDQVDFMVITPENIHAQVQIVIVEGGKKYNEYAPLFSDIPENENTFYASAQSDTSMTYTTFFEGKLWDIVITLPTKSAEKDFYNILKPVRFEKQYAGK